MYKTVKETEAFLKAILPDLPRFSAEAWLAVPYTSILTAARLALGTTLRIGAQNLYGEKEGAYTGEISSRMLADAGASFVLIGHSERRQIFHEESPLLNRKIALALEAKLQPLFCVGETLMEREKGMTEEVLQRQLVEALVGFKKEDLHKIIIAYEPVWAIGTGKVATSEIAEKAHAAIRYVLEKNFDMKELPLLYGGSVKPENAAALLQQPDIDGLLVGRASLSHETFLQILARASS